MKTQLIIAIAGIFFGAFGFAQTGTLSGKLQQNELGESKPLPMAKVRSLEEGKGAYTDEMGAFKLELKTGLNHIVVSYVGLITDTLEFTIVENEVTEFEYVMRDNNEFKAVVIIVNGVKDGGSEIKAVEDTKNDDKVVTIQTNEQMEKKGAGDVGETTKKMTGLSQVGTVLYVRGLGDRYNVAYLNGLPLPSPDPDFRVVPLSIFPTDIVSSVQVSKVMSPELYGDFAGGAFNITTKSFYDEPTFKLSIGSGMNTQTTFKDFRTYNGGKFDYFGFDDGTRNIPNYVLQNSTPAAYKEINSIYPSSLYNSVEGKTTGFNDNFGTYLKKALPNTSFSMSGGTFMPFANSTDKSKGIGFLALVSHDNSYNYSYGSIRNINAQSESRLNYDIEKYNYSTSTTGLFNFYVRINPEHNISFNSLYINTSDDETRESWGTHYDYARSIYSNRLTYKQNYLFTNQLIGTHKFLLHPEDQNFARLLIDWRASYSVTGSKEPDRRQYVAFYDEDKKDDFEHYTFMYIDRNENHRFYSLLNETELAAKFNGSFVLLYEEINDSLGRGKQIEDIITIHAGADYKSKYRQFDYKQYNYVLNTLASNTVDNVNIYDMDSYLNSTVHDDGQFYIQEVANFGSSYIASLDVISGYADVKFRLNKWEIIPGVRYESGFQMVMNRNQQAPSIIEKTILNNSNILPSLITKYSLTEKDIFRFVASKTVTRPKFNEVAPFQYTLFFAGMKAEGNPDLKNSENYNIDFRYERYPAPGQMITIGGFYKYIVNPIEQNMRATASGQLMSYANATTANVGGIEFEYMRDLSFLVSPEKRDSSFLKDFGLGFNAAYIYTLVEIDTNDLGGISTNYRRPLEGASPYLINFDLFYQKEIAINDSTTREYTIAFAYNVFGPRLTSVGGNGIGDQYALPVSSLNFVAKVEFNNHLSIGFKAKNILNPEIRIVQEDKVQDGYLNVSSFRRGIDMSFSIGYTF